MAPDAGTAWASLRIGELKAMLCLAIGDDEQAAEWIDWCLQIDQLDEVRSREYRCMQVLLEIKLDESRDYDDYVESLAKMFGEENVKTGIDIIEGRELFHGLHSPGLSLEGFNTHKK